MGEQQLLDSVENMMRKENGIAVQLKQDLGINTSEDYL